eukprot:TRINITY_DN54384_c0_g1_i1.p1 TRINITY_DN54384_c0_g1~~TRINITY_DN54384_c0_g1_i1.p1  ORF type:complete len:128 (-),score=24.04 TRINITY_DN54384_c0_g1_i1:306-689(-)
MTKSHYQDYVELQKQKDVAIVAFPCNQFGGQEPGNSAAIKQFAAGKGLTVNTPDSTFKLMEKVDVNGPNQHPVYAFLKKHSGSDDIRWNFATKFIVRCGKKTNTCSIDRHDGTQKPSAYIPASRDEI